MFQSILPDNPKLEVEQDEDGNYVIAVPLALHNIDQRLVNLVCEIEPFILDDEETFQFLYSIQIIALNDDFEPFETMESAIARPYIPNDIRGRIVDLVLDCVRLFVEELEMSKIYMVAKEGDLPEKALRKHGRLIQTFEELDFYLDVEGEDPSGRLTWTMRR